MSRGKGRLDPSAPDRTAFQGVTESAWSDLLHPAATDDARAGTIVTENALDFRRLDFPRILSIEEAGGRLS